MKYVSTEKKERQKLLAINMTFEAFKNQLELTTISDENLRERFEMVDEIFERACCFKAIANSESQRITYSLLARTETDIIDYFSNKLCDECYDLDILSLELLLLKMLEQKPSYPLTVAKSRLINHMNRVKSNIMGTDGIQFSIIK